MYTWHHIIHFCFGTNHESMHHYDWPQKTWSSLLLGDQEETA